LRGDVVLAVDPGHDPLLMSNIALLYSENSFLVNPRG
jgi:hypothetical protein